MLYALRGIVWIAFLLAISLSGTASGEDFTINDECTTTGTNVNGARTRCDSDSPGCQVAPGDHVISERTVQKGCSDCNGNLSVEESCAISFHDPVEIIPDIFQSKKVCVTARAESPPGMNNAGKRGWAKCWASGKMVKYPK